MKTFVCENCKGQVLQEHILDIEGRGEYWYRCQECKGFYGRPVYERELDFYGSLDVFDPGLVPWVEQDQIGVERVTAL